MAEQQKKKITEIREALEKIDRGDLFEIAMAHEKSGEWIRSLLAELCELEKENRKLRERLKEEIVWQDECLKLEEQLQSAHQEIERLREELNAYKPSAEVFYERLKIRDELLEQLHAQIKYYFGGDGGLAKLQDGVNKLLQERQRLIDGLLTIMNIASEDGLHWKLDRCYTTARDILREIGVTVS